MSGRRPGDLYVDACSPLHSARAECKILATFLFVLAVVATPREALWAFGVYAAAVVLAALVGRLPVRQLVRRLAIELPFVAFAFALPLVAGGEQVSLGALALSVDGLWGGWNILAKGTLGVAAAIVLTATTPLTELITGLQRLAIPRAFVIVMTLMVRFGVILADQARSMQVARLSRGYDPRWFWQVRALATSAGTLFVRSYERGERVHLAMLSRGYTGEVPDLGGGRAGPRDWLRSLAAPAAAVVVACLAWVTRS